MRSSSQLSVAARVDCYELICREERGGGRGIAKKNRRRIPSAFRFSVRPERRRFVMRNLVKTMNWRTSAQVA